MSVLETIVEVFTEVASEQNRLLAPLVPNTPLHNLGLDSLCMAVIIIRLEERLGTDPFSSGEGGEAIQTFGDFVALYEQVDAA